MAVTLVTGPVRAGKSRYVNQIAQASGKRVRFIATAIREADDGEWDVRLRRHMQERPREWELVESASLTHEELVEIIASAGEDRCLVIDALGTWLAARIATHIEEFQRDYAAFEAQLDAEAAQLADVMLRSAADVVVVAEEVGWDIVPVAASARLFRDVLGRMKQRLAAESASVYLVVCGYALDLRALGVTIT
ncbi:MAG: bifunctional adenosylcobinamide kinase/adenosylcobinamide-phosphate guanylyltransferase [bacterium]|nr:bifunctional adenosylcobinamide kinase/adenosylcobinamide-phosphate guanylyltransferase [bacterium]